MDLQNPIFFEASQVSSTNPNWHFVCASVNPTGTQIRPCPQLFWACIRIPFPDKWVCFPPEERSVFRGSQKASDVSEHPKQLLKRAGPRCLGGRFEVTVNPVTERDGWWDIRISCLVDRNPNCQAPTVEDSSSPATKRLKTEVPGPVTWQMAVAWGGGMKLSMKNDIPVAFKLTDSRLNFKTRGSFKIRWVFRVSPASSDDLINLKCTMAALQTADTHQESQQAQASEWIRGKLDDLSATIWLISWPAYQMKLEMPKMGFTLQLYYKTESKWRKPQVHQWKCVNRQMSIHPCKVHGDCCGRKNCWKMVGDMFCCYRDSQLDGWESSCTITSSI